MSIEVDRRRSLKSQNQLFYGLEITYISALNAVMN